MDFLSKFFGPKKKVPTVDKTKLNDLNIRGKVKYLIENDNEEEAIRTVLNALLADELIFVEREEESINKRIFDLNLNSWFFYEINIDDSLVSGNFYELDWNHNGKSRNVIFNYVYDLKSNKILEQKNNRLENGTLEAIEKAIAKTISFAKEHTPYIPEDVKEKIDLILSLVDEIEKSSMEIFSPEEKKLVSKTKDKVLEWTNNVKMATKEEKQEAINEILFNIEKRLILLNGFKDLTTQEEKEVVDW